MSGQMHVVGLAGCVKSRCGQALRRHVKLHQALLYFSEQEMVVAL